MYPLIFQSTYQGPWLRPDDITPHKTDLTPFRKTKDFPQSLPRCAIFFFIHCTDNLRFHLMIEKKSHPNTNLGKTPNRKTYKYI